MRLLEVPVRESDEPPDDSEDEPRADEAQTERKQRPTPLGIDEGRKDVLQESQALLRQLRLDDIALAIFEDRSLSVFLCCSRPTEREENENWLRQMNLHNFSIMDNDALSLT
jgi:hypothetical protein